MQTITTTQLEVVSGGASKSTEISSALNGVKDALSTATSKNSSSGGLGDPMTMMMMGLMLSQKNQGPTVVSAGAAPAPVVAGGPVINVNTRVRRGW